LYVFISSQK